MKTLKSKDKAWVAAGASELIRPYTRVIKRLQGQLQPESVRAYRDSSYADPL
jgi:hypothetical protein